MWRSYECRTEEWERDFPICFMPGPTSPLEGRRRLPIWHCRPWGWPRWAERETAETSLSSMEGELCYCENVNKVQSALLTPCIWDKVRFPRNIISYLAPKSLLRYKHFILIRKNKKDDWKYNRDQEWDKRTPSPTCAHTHTYRFGRNTLIFKCKFITVICIDMGAG